MSSRGGRTKMTARMRTQQQPIDLNGSPSEPQRVQRVTRQTPVVPQPVSVTPTIDLVAIDDDDDDDDVVEATASDFAQAKNKSRGTLQGTILVDGGESGGSTRLTKNRKKRRCGQASVDGDEVKNSRKSEAVVAPVEEPTFNCPICMCPFTEETTTKCGHIFCYGCITNALSRQDTCPTCRKKVSAKHLIRIFLPTTR